VRLIHDGKFRWSIETQKMLRGLVGFRCETYGGSGVRNVIDVVETEIFGLGNEHVLRDSCRALGIPVASCCIENLILDLKKRYGGDAENSYAIWLGRYEDVKESYCGPDETPERVPIPTDALVLSDMGPEGALFVWRKPKW